jgi:hypothetical protein
MAVKAVKQAVEPIQPESIPEIADVNLEDAIADQLLDDIDWQKVTSAVVRKAPAKLFAWLTRGTDRPISISAFPELSALPSSQDGEAA